MEVLLVLLGMAAIIGVVVGAVLGVVAYLRAVIRASARCADWVPAVMRVGFSLFVGVLGCHLVMGGRRMEREMGIWYFGLTLGTIALASVALSHLAVWLLARKGNSGDGVVAIGMLAAIAGVPLFALALALLGDH